MEHIIPYRESFDMCADCDIACESWKKFKQKQTNKNTHICQLHFKC